MGVRSRLLGGGRGGAGRQRSPTGQAAFRRGPMMLCSLATLAYRRRSGPWTFSCSFNVSAG